MRKISVLPLLSGLLLCGVLAGGASLLGETAVAQHAGLGALTLAIIVGMVVGNLPVIKLRAGLAPGIGFARAELLRVGIVLYGFRLTLHDVATVGARGVLSDVLVLSSTFLLALWIGIRWLQMDRKIVMLIGAGSSICGAAAVMATDGVVRGKAEQVSVAVSSVVVFGSVAMVLYPLLFRFNLDGQWLSTSAKPFGVYLGSTVHEVAQVVAAGRSIGPEVANVAVITKMVRVMMLAPFLMMLPWLMPIRQDHAAKQPVTVPWFAFLFIGMVLVNSLQCLPVALVNVLVQTDTALLAAAMVGLGLTTHMSAVREAGPKPLFLAFVLLVWLVVAGAAVNRLVFWL